MRFDHDEIVRLRREEGLSVPDIVSRLGCSRRTVTAALRRAGMGVKHPPSQFNITREQLLTLWNEGLTMMMMGVRLGCSASTVSLLVRQHRLPMRPPIRKEALADPTPSEIERLKAEIRQRHIDARRREDNNETRKRVWREDIKAGRIPLEVA